MSNKKTDTRDGVIKKECHKEYYSDHPHGDDGDPYGYDLCWFCDGDGKDSDGDTCPECGGSGKN